MYRITRGFFSCSFPQDFLACLPIASRLHHLKIVAKAMKERQERREELAAGKESGRGGADGGFARREIEIRLTEAQWRMADAEADQDYSLCTRLQRDIKNLEVCGCCCRGHDEGRKERDP